MARIEAFFPGTPIGVRIAVEALRAMSRLSAPRGCCMKGASPGGYVVKDATGQALAYVYGRETRADSLLTQGRMISC